MNVYEEAHNLARAIKESQEYLQYISLKKEVDQDPELKNTIEEFEKKQIKLQAEQILNNDGVQMPNMETLSEAVQEMASLFSSNPLAAQYVQAKLRFSLMVNDAYKIIADASGIGNFV